MDDNILVGKLVRLTVEEAKEIAENIHRWNRNAAYQRLLSTDIAQQYSQKASQEWIEKNLQGDNPTLIHFMIRTLQDDKVIGDISLDGIQWNQGESYVGIGIGEPDYWGRGFGTDAMRIILRYAFHELNLHRVTLTVFDYNERAIRSYEKAGFIFEGRERQIGQRNGKRFDIITMGILKEEWEAIHRQ